MEQDFEAADLRQVLGVLRRRLPLIVLCGAVVAAAAFGFSKRQTKKYTATASIVFSDDSLSQQIAGLAASSSNSSNLLARQANDLELVKSGDMAAKTASLVGHGLTHENVSESLNIAGQGESGVVDVSATSALPMVAAAIANTYTGEFVKEQQDANRQYFKSALALIDKQLAALSPQQRIGADGLQLQNRAQTLSLLAELKYGDAQIAREALVPTGPSSPKTSRNLALGLLMGLIMGLGLAFVLEHLDRRVRRPEELERIYRLPSLGAVPKSATLARSAREKGGARAVLPPAEAEAFNLIRAHLRFFNVNRVLRTVIVASPAPGDGKSTIARHLAEAAARLGSRVLLLEGDLRHPTLARQLDIQSGPGLAEVLLGAVRMDEATQRVALEVGSGGGGVERTLDVLSAGAVLPPNPAELLGSQAMDAVIEQTKSAYDLVVIDTPPLTAVSDAFPLLTKVDGVVIAGWVGRSRRDAAERLHQILADSGATLLGVIANGSRSGGQGSYDYARPPGSSLSSHGAASTNGASPSEDLISTAKA
jgi:capsular exopolysaccharide synthesis family protein